MDDRYLHYKGLAEFYGVSTRSIRNWVKDGRIPAPERLPNGRPAWRESTIKAVPAVAA